MKENLWSVYENRSHNISSSEANEFSDKPFKPSDSHPNLQIRAHKIESEQNNVHEKIKTLQIDVYNFWTKLERVLLINTKKQTKNQQPQHRQSSTGQHFFQEAAVGTQEMGRGGLGAWQRARADAWEKWFHLLGRFLPSPFLPRFCYQKEKEHPFSLRSH